MQELIKKAKAGRKHLDFLDVLLTARVSAKIYNYKKSIIIHS